MEAFTKTAIVTDIIDEIPLSEAEVNFPGAFFRLGDPMTPTQVKDEPKVLWAAEKDSFYTLAFVDPDLPAEYRHFLHWLVINIPGSDIAQGDHYVTFMGSAPPKGSGLHRYTFLVFKQPGKVEVTDRPRVTLVTQDSFKNRIKFDMKQWIQKYGLGRAVAGTFYRAEFEKK